MTESKINQSEVARILERIENEYVAAQRGLTGLAQSARHTAITARIENLGRLHESLRAVAGEDAMKLIAECLENIPEE